MKKFLTLFLSILLVFSLTGCNKTYIKVESFYWQTQSGYDNTYYEELVYDVTCVNKTISNSTEVSSDQLELVVNEGSTYTIISKSAVDKGGDVICVETKLSIDGKYIDKANDNTVLAFVDEISSICYFTATNFKPIYSSKTVKANSISFQVDKYKLLPYEYEYEVTYEGENAKVEFNEIKDEYQIIDVDDVKTYKGATKNAYLDNEMMLFAPRGYSLLNENTTSIYFDSLDVISQTTREMYFTTITNSDGKKTPVTINCLNQEIETVKVMFYLTGQFTGSPIECYYATKTQDRNRLIRCYTTMYGDLGYLQYTLKEIK